MSDTITAPITIPAPDEITAPITLGFVGEAISDRDHYLEITRSTIIVSGVTPFGAFDPNGEYTWTPASNAFVFGDFTIFRNVSGTTTTWYLHLSGAEIAVRDKDDLVGEWKITDANYGVIVSPFTFFDVEFGTRSTFFSGVSEDISSKLTESVYGDIFSFGRGVFTYSGMPYDGTADSIGNHKLLPARIVLQGSGIHSTTIKLVAVGHSINDGGFLIRALRLGGESIVRDLTLDANAEENITNIGVYHQDIANEQITAGVSGSVQQVETITVPSSILGYVGDMKVTVSSGFNLFTGSNVTFAMLEGDDTIEKVAVKIETAINATDLPSMWAVSQAAGVITLTATTTRANETSFRAYTTPVDYIKSFEFPARYSTANYGLNPHYGTFSIYGENTQMYRVRHIGWTGGGANMYEDTYYTSEQYGNADSGRYSVFDGCIFEEPVNIAKDNAYANALSCRFGGIYRNNIVRYPETDDDFWILGDGTYSGAPTFAFGVHDNTIFENNIAFNCEAMFHRDTLAINHCVMRGNHAYNVGYGVLFQMTGGNIARNITIEDNTFEVRALNGSTTGRSVIFSCSSATNATFGVKIHNNTFIGGAATDYGILMGNTSGGLASAPFMQGVSLKNNTSGYMTDKTTSTRAFTGDILNTFQNITEALNPGFLLDYEAETAHQILIDGATIAYDCNLAYNAQVTLTDARTLAPITNAPAGSSGTLWIIQDDFGGWALTLDASQTDMNGTLANITAQGANEEAIIKWTTRNGTDFEFFITAP